MLTFEQFQATRRWSDNLAADIPGETWEGPAQGNVYMGTIPSAARLGGVGPMILHRFNVQLDEFAVSEGYIGVDAITDADIKTAVAMADLDAACLHLQNIAHVDDGGIAGMVFSDTEFDWATADAAERERMIRQWIATERAYSEGPQ